MNSTIALEPPFLAQRDACIGHNANLVTHMVRTFCLATLSYKHAISNLVLSSQGYSMRTAEWRYAEWPRWVCHGADGNPNSCSDMGKAPGWSASADWSNLGGRELYSHAGDVGDCFDCFENENLVDKPEHAALVAQLSKQLRAGWRAAQPHSEL